MPSPLIKSNLFEDMSHVDFEKDVPWHLSVDLGKNLLPVDEKSPFFSMLNDDEKHAVSWALGLLAASSIKEHEKILNELRAIAYPENKAEGLTFFLEEAIHSMAYQRFLDQSAKALNVTPSELSTFLPSFKKNSLIAKTYALEGMLGGNAIWWAVAATEEESIRLFQQISHLKETTDPLFFRLNHLHFIEESRHSSFSYHQIHKKKNVLQTMLRKSSFITSRVLHTIWLLQELSSFKKVLIFRDRHPLLEQMARVYEKFETMTFRRKLQIVLDEITYTRMLMHPEEYPRLRRALKKKKTFSFRLPVVP